jgi:hypothetical protein
MHADRKSPLEQVKGKVCQDSQVTEAFLTLFSLMCILAELDTQRKSLLKKGEEVPSHMVQPLFEELMAGRVQTSPDETPEEKDKCISAFRFMVEFLTLKVHSIKGWEAEMCSIPLQLANSTASDETMTKLALENMWQQWHAASGSMETKERGKYTQQGTKPERNGMVSIGTMNNCSRKLF